MEHHNLKLQLSPNLHIVGEKIISYETHVASIKKNWIESFGKFSRTTGKQIGSVARLIGLPIYEAYKDIPFYKHEQGVRCNGVVGETLSRDISLMILRAKDKDEFLEFLIRHLQNGKSIKRSDWRMLCQEWGLPEDTPRPVFKGDITWLS